MKATATLTTLKAGSSSDFNVAELKQKCYDAMNDDFNMSMRKFLKQVGVTSQQAIEDAMRDADTSGKTFDNVAPATGSVIGQVHEAGREEVDAAVTAARAALSSEWGELGVDQRCELLYRVADGINNRFN